MHWGLHARADDLYPAHVHVHVALADRRLYLTGCRCRLRPQYPANMLTQHAVPQTDAERTGSVVFRSIKTLIQPDDPRLPASIRKKRVDAAGGRGGKRPRVS
jgi:hypothetical protein